MSRGPGIVVYVLVMVALIIGLDVAFLSHHFLERLLVNIAVVVIFIAFYFVVLKRV